MPFHFRVLQLLGPPHDQEAAMGGPPNSSLSLQLSLAGRFPAAMAGTADQHAGSGPQLDAPW